MPKKTVQSFGLFKQLHPNISRNLYYFTCDDLSQMHRHEEISHLALLGQNKCTYA